MQISVDLTQLRQIQAQLARAPDVVRDELVAAMTEADLLLEREVKERTPKAHGLLRESIIGTEHVGALGVEGVVGSPLIYAAPVELGTKPHFPPVDALVDWVKTQLHITDEREARGVAFLVGRKIARSGTKGAFMFQKSFDAMRAQIDQIFAQAQARIVTRLGGA